MRFDTLPPEFSGLKVNYVQKVSSREWSGSCPQCGGEPHKGGDLPDRFRMWTNANGKNKIMGWCRRCSYVWFPTHDSPMSKEEFEAWRKQQIEVETRKKLEAERALKFLQSEKIWEQYHSELNNWAFEVLESWGITKHMAAFWRLGLIKDYIVNNEYHSPAISIPVWGPNKDVRNVKVRVLNPRTGSDRYRALYKTGFDSLFFSRWDLQSDTCLVVEGEKKAMVSSIHVKDIQVVGTPSVTPSPSALKELEPFKKIYLCLDPDSKNKSKNGTSPLRRMVDILGKERVKIVNLPEKVDDMLIKYKLNLGDALLYSR